MTDERTARLPLLRLRIAYFCGEFLNSFVLAKMKIMGALKRVEHEDYYDRATDFNPFTLRA